MEGGDQEEQKHACKLCRRSFPCGRSLGGHMRAHLPANSPPSAAEADGHTTPPQQPPSQSQSSQWAPGSHGARGGRGPRYVLRENPKKTWRLHNSAGAEIPPEGEKLCSECGRGFPSWRALFGHMRCHPAARSSPNNHKEQEQAEEAENHEEGEEPEPEPEPEPEQEQEGQDGSWIGMATPRRGTVRARSKRGPAPAAPSSLACEIRRELEDVARSLMMLSRDVGYWGGFDSIAESSDRNSAALEEAEAKNANKNEDKNKNEPCEAELEDSDDDVELGRDSAKRPRLRRALAELEKTNSELEKLRLVKSGKSDAAHKHKLGSSSAGKPAHRRSLFECTICGRVFSSYQALGGHKTSHRRAKSCPAPKAEGGESSAETPISAAEEAGLGGQAVGVAEEASWGSSKKASHHHECGICLRVFPSGPALGGHMRCHFSGGAAVEGQLSAVPGAVLDLNLPAASADEDGNGSGGQVGFSPWWVGGDQQGELVSS